MIATAHAPNPNARLPSVVPADALENALEKTSSDESIFYIKNIKTKKKIYIQKDKKKVFFWFWEFSIFFQKEKEIIHPVEFGLVSLSIEWDLRFELKQRYQRNKGRKGNSQNSSLIAGSFPRKEDGKLLQAAF